MVMSVVGRDREIRSLLLKEVSNEMSNFSIFQVV